MTILLSYCLKLSISLALVSMFYHFGLRKLTFYNWNRYYLLGYSLLSFLVAFINISPVLQQKEWSAKHFVQWIPSLDSNEIITTNVKVGTDLSFSNVLEVLLISGVVVMALRLLLQFISFKRLTRKAELMFVEGIKFYQVTHPVIPFSFGNSIFINRGQHSEQELREIIRHEFVHVKERHSIDILWAEMLCLLNWYNPFVWLLKAHIRQNLEFIADKQVLKSGISRKQYQYLLLKVVGNNQFSMAPKFNFSSLKKRITMMNKSKSSRLNLVRFLFILPLVIVSLLAFRNQAAKNFTVSKKYASPTDKGAKADTIPNSSKSPKKATADENNLSTCSDSFEITGDRAVVHLKNGTTEEYDLRNKEQKKRFEDKLGKIINTEVLSEIKERLIECDTSVRNEVMTTVHTITTDEVMTAVAPTTVISASGSGYGRGNGNGNGNRCVTVNGIESVVANVNALSETAVAVNANVPATTAVIAPTTASETAVAITGEDGNLIAITPEVLFTITKNTTRQQLEELKKQMKEKGFNLNFEETKYTDGKLVFINGIIESKDIPGKTFFVAETFSKLIISIINDGNHTYFKIDEQRAVKRVI